VPIAIFSGFSMAQGFVLNSATTNVAKAIQRKTQSLFASAHYLCRFPKLKRNLS